MIKIALSVLLLFNAIKFEAQNTIEAVKLGSQSYNYDQYIDTDEFGYHYFYKNKALVKLSNTEIFEFKNISLGLPTRIDLHNPLKIVLFYENFNTVICLDNQLNEVSNINFSSFETPILASAIGIAAQNRFWIFNMLSQKIGLFDFLNNKFMELTPPLQLTKKTYNSDFNYFYWIDADNMLHSCDLFGKITTLGQVADCEKIQIIDSQKVLILKNNRLFINNLTKNTSSEHIINEKTILDFSLKNQILTIFTNQEIHTYQIKL